MSCSRLEDSTFFDSLKMGYDRGLLFTLPWKTEETFLKICKDLFLSWRVGWVRTPNFVRKIGVSSREDLFFSFFGGRLKKIFWDLFLDYTCALCPWPRAFLSLACLERVCPREVGPWPRISLCPWPRRRPLLKIFFKRNLKAKSILF